MTKLMASLQSERERNLNVHKEVALLNTEKHKIEDLITTSCPAERGE